jgi:hypothetical protein
MKIVIQCGNPDKLIWCSPTTFFFPERYLLHPKLHIEFIEGLIRDIDVNDKYHKAMFADDTIYIITNSEHIINRCRVAKKEKEIEKLEIQFSPFDSEENEVIRVDKNGELDTYPKYFMDEWSNQLLKLI